MTLWTPEEFGDWGDEEARQTKENLGRQNPDFKSDFLSSQYLAAELLGENDPYALIRNQAGRIDCLCPKKIVEVLACTYALWTTDKGEIPPIPGQVYVIPEVEWNVEGNDPQKMIVTVYLKFWIDWWILYSIECTAWRK